MKDTVDNKLIDLNWEHAQHNKYESKCSSCWAENMVLRMALKNKCISCGGLATRTNYTLCQSCWYDAEGTNE